MNKVKIFSAIPFIFTAILFDASAALAKNTPVTRKSPGTPTVSTALVQPADSKTSTQATEITKTKEDIKSDTKVEAINDKKKDDTDDHMRNRQCEKDETKEKKDKCVGRQCQKKCTLKPLPLKALPVLLVAPPKIIQSQPNAISSATGTQ